MEIISEPEETPAPVTRREMVCPALTPTVAPVVFPVPAPELLSTVTESVLAELSTQRVAVIEPPIPRPPGTALALT